MTVMKGDESKVSGCIGCGECSKICGYTDPWKVMMYMNCTVNSMEIPQTFRETGYHIPSTGRPDVPPAEYTEGGDVCLSPGCLVNAIVPYLEDAGVAALGSIGLSVERLDSGCCTFPVHYRSMTDGERDSIKIESVKDSNGRRIVTLCPGCSNELSDSGLNAYHIVELLHSNIESIRRLPGVKMRVCVQPGCHLRHLEKEFIEVVEATGAEIIEAPIGCCGKVVPGISGMIMSERQNDMKGADAVVVGCPSCFIRYDSVENGIRVLHISELVAMASGHDRTLNHHRN